MGDTRVSTNVTNPDGSRAVGTRHDEIGAEPGAHHRDAGGERGPLQVLMEAGSLHGEILILTGFAQVRPGD
jgi:hypothetical protein